MSVHRVAMSKYTCCNVLIYEALRFINRSVSELNERFISRSPFLSKQRDRKRHNLLSGAEFYGFVGCNAGLNADWWGQGSAGIAAQVGDSAEMSKLRGYMSYTIAQLSYRIFSEGHTFSKNVLDLDGLPEMTWSMPEVLILGANNSGKTQLARALLGNNDIYERLDENGNVSTESTRKISFQSLNTSAKQGNTPSLTFFNVGDCFYLVDSPGWGAVQNKNRALRSEGLATLKKYLYLRRNGALQHVYVCIDCSKIYNEYPYRIQSNFSIASKDGINFEKIISERDKDIINFLNFFNISFTLVMTKIDKLNHSQSSILQPNLTLIKRCAETILSKFKVTNIPINQTEAHSGTPKSTGPKDLINTPRGNGTANSTESTDIIPFIEVSAMLNWNIDALRADMVYQCFYNYLLSNQGNASDAQHQARSSEIFDSKLSRLILESGLLDESASAVINKKSHIELLFNEVKTLSYAPPTIEEKTAADHLFPNFQQGLPLYHYQSLEDYKEMVNNKRKMEYLLKSTNFTSS